MVIKRIRIDEPVLVYFEPIQWKVLVEAAVDDTRVLDATQDFSRLFADIPDHRPVHAAKSLKKHYRRNFAVGSEQLKSLASTWIWEEASEWNYRGIGKHIRILFADFVIPHPYFPHSFPEDSVLFLRFETAVECPVEVFKTAMVTMEIVENSFMLSGITASGFVEMEFPPEDQMNEAFFDRLMRVNLFFPYGHHVTCLKTFVDATRYSYPGAEAGYKVMYQLIGTPIETRLLELMQQSEGLNARILHRLHLTLTVYGEPRPKEQTVTQHIIRPSVPLFLLLHTKPDMFGLAPFVAGTLPIDTNLKLVAYPNTKGTCYASSTFRLLQANEPLMKLLNDLESEYAKELLAVLSPGILGSLPQMLTFLKETLDKEKEEDTNGGWVHALLEAIASKLVAAEGYAALQEVVNVERNILLCTQCGKFEALNTPHYQFAQRMGSSPTRACLTALTQGKVADYIQSRYLFFLGDGEKVYLPLMPSELTCPFGCVPTEGETKVKVYEIPTEVAYVLKPVLFALPAVMHLPTSFLVEGVPHQVVMRALRHETKDSSHVRNLIYAQDGKHPDILLDDDETTLLAKEDVADNIRVADEYLQATKWLPDLAVAYSTADEIPSFDYHSLAFVHPEKVPKLLAKPLPPLLSEVAWFAQIRSMIEELKHRWWP